ncbi:hypothetical protein [Methylophilus sp. DW102]|uniref:hypothetical protein n=1 Tax=Methylophilus sp. DW102 TaxID=3095607 RepID=UPI00308EC74A|nr:hypothetical protein MTDW_12880 [Methylophilus sp. DW102]
MSVKTVPVPKKSFLKAFDMSIGSCRGECTCGRQFFNDDGTWDWGEGELESLRADKSATELPYAVSFVQFEDNQYVYDCDCWHVRANQIQAFIDSHLREISNYINAEIIEINQHARHMQTLMVKDFQQ